MVQSPSMEFPAKFRAIHAETIFAAWVKAGQPPVVNFFMREMFRSPVLAGPRDRALEEVLVVSARCENVRGVLCIRALTAADLERAREWEVRYRAYDKADFDWHPGLRAYGELVRGGDN